MAVLLMLSGVVRMFLSRILQPLTLFILFASPVLAEGNTEYTLLDLDGKVHSIAELRGNWLVMNFWATWCAPCISEMPELEKFYQKHKEQDAMVWGVNFEEISKEDLLKFLARVHVTYPILGHKQTPETGFGQVKVLPTTFLIDPNGKFYKRFEGPVTADQLEDEIQSAIN